MRVGIVTALYQPVKQGWFDCLATVLDVEVKAGLGQGVLNVIDYLPLNTFFVMTDVLPH